MVITRLEEPEQKERGSTKKSSRNARIKVYIDEIYAFPLYLRDINTLGLQEGMELPLEIKNRIIENIIYPRAKQKALDLLKFQDRTEQELRHKLKQQLYPEDIIDCTIEYVMKYGYLDDERYASFYIKARMERKSKRLLYSELVNKGIHNTILDKIFTEEYHEQEEDPELIAIRKAIGRSMDQPSMLTWEEKQKIIAKLYRKGFALDKINQILKFDDFS